MKILDSGIAKLTGTDLMRMTARPRMNLAIGIDRASVTSGAIDEALLRLQVEILHFLDLVVERFMRLMTN